MKAIISIITAMLILFSDSQGQINLMKNDPPIEQDKTLSPYFLVKSDNPDVDQLPLYLTKADVKIAGVIADVTVTQVYKNTGKSPLEAIYVFPASTKAAVYGMTMTIGERILKAEIQERQKARETYEKAKEEGKSASLLEQERPNVFQMNVANIMPGDSIIVELKYTELLVPSDKIYEFVYPTVVGPRYSNKPKEGADDTDKFVETPYQHEGEAPSYKFDINISLKMGVPLYDLTCGTHEIKLKEISNNEVSISLDKTEEYSGNKDFILQYSLSGDKIETGLLLSDTGEEKFFLLMLQPPKKTEPEDIPLREYIFVVDVSGSMRGFPLDVSKSVMKKLLDGLRPKEKFNILFFAGSSEMLFDQSMEVNEENLNKAYTMLDNIQGSGGTELLPAMKRVLSIKKDPKFSRSILVLTDGYVDVEEETFDLIRNNLDESNIFAFGIGNGVNRYLIEGIARAGMGEPFVVTNSREADKNATKFYNYVKAPIMTDINVEYDIFDTYDVEPKTIPDVFSDRPIIIFGKYKDNPEGNIRVSGIYGDKRYKVDVKVLKFGTRIQGDALKYLWARNKIATISDYATVAQKEEFKTEVTNLGLKYNLLTNYTSFVAVDYLKRRGGDSVVTVKQALPMPEGVSDYAIGRGMVYMATAGGRSGASPLAPMMSKKASLELSDGGGVDKGGFSSNIDFDTKKEIRLKEKESGIDDFVPVEQAPKVDLKILQKNIVYPELARRAGIEGKVLVRVLIDKTGSPTKHRIEYSDNTMLEQPAVDAIMKSSFTPAIQKGNAVACWVTLPVVFKLNDNHEYIETIKEGSGEEVKPGDKITFHYKGSYDSFGDGEFANSYKSGEPMTFVYGKDKKYEALNSWFKNMKTGEIRRIDLPKSKNEEIEKIFNGKGRNANIFFEIELIGIE
jgi:Ca-activated chloride channel homolog